MKVLEEQFLEENYLQLYHAIFLLSVGCSLKRIIGILMVLDDKQKKKKF
jgi:hypothetical protein